MLIYKRFASLKAITGWTAPIGGAILVLSAILLQSHAGTESQVYPIKHAQASEINAALAAILPSGTEVTVDSQTNQLNVRGTAEAQQIAQNAIRSLDRPGSTPTAGTDDSASKPVLQAHRCLSGQAEPTAARLRQQLSGVDDVRIVADARTSQVLVLAVPEIQKRVAQQIAGTEQPTERRAAAAGGPIQPAAPRDSNDKARAAAAGAAVGGFQASARAAVSGTPQSQVVQLWHTTAAQLEKSLAGALGKRMVALAATAPGTMRYRLVVAGGRRLDLTLNGNSNRVTIGGHGQAVAACARLIHAMDGARQAGGINTQVVPLGEARRADLQRAVKAIQAGNQARPRPTPQGGQPVSMLMQQETDPEQPVPPAEAPALTAEQPATGQEPDETDAPGEPDGAQRGSLVGPVQVELLDGLDVLVIRGHRRDVEQVIGVINQIERLSAVTEPVIEVYHLHHVDCEALSVLVNELYGQIFLPRQGEVSVTALVKPNALLMIGQRASVDTAMELVKKLDRPVPPETQFRVFRLRHASAETVQAQVQEFYTERAGLGTKVVVTADFRSNSLIAQARPRDMLELEALITRLDTSVSEAVNEIRVFQLENSLAEDLAPILQAAIGGDETAGARPAPGQAAQRNQGTDAKSAMLSLLAVDTQGQRRLKSGILTDARITADARANALVVSAPAESMPLLEALIRQLDQLPAAEAQIKVFTIINGDAPSLVEMLEALFNQQQGATGDQLPIQTAATAGESSLVPLRFAVDIRTNSIIASGTRGDLIVVEAILLRLDDSDVRNRKSLVYRLRNAPATDVANAVNEFLRSERQVQQVSPGLMSAFEQIEREVVVVPEVVSNSLIISATPRFYDEIVQLIEEIDKRPPMVMIQVLIAEVGLNDTDEFGVELGLQDSILFDRSILDNIQTLTNSTVSPNGVRTETQNIISADIAPGFAFNNQTLGNSGAGTQNSQQVGGQALSSLGVNRVNTELGFGGLVLSASSESVSILIRALKECRRTDILSRPQVMTLDNQPAFIQVGQEVPTIRGTQLNETGQINNIEYANVGLILGVTPRISPDGLVVMEIDAVKSEVGPEEEGIPISISATGEIIRSPRINTTRAQTTVSALDGQTIVLGGLITKSKSKIHRRVPMLASIPLVGNLFRYDNVTSRRTELLIIMSPHIVSDEEDADRLKQVESARMSWCLGDAMELHGDVGLESRQNSDGEGGTPAVYPDLDFGPAGLDGEVIQTPEPLPLGNPGDPPPAPAGLPPKADGSSSALPFLPKVGKTEKPPFRPFDRLRQQFAKKKPEEVDIPHQRTPERDATPAAVVTRVTTEAPEGFHTEDSSTAANRPVAFENELRTVPKRQPSEAASFPENESHPTLLEK